MTLRPQQGREELWETAGGTGQTGTRCAASGLGWSKMLAVWRLFKFPDEDQSGEKLETSSWLRKRTQETNEKLCKLKPDFCDSEEIFLMAALTKNFTLRQRPEPLPDQSSWN